MVKSVFLLIFAVLNKNRETMKDMLIYPMSMLFDVISKEDFETYYNEFDGCYHTFDEEMQCDVGYPFDKEDEYFHCIGNAVESLDKVMADAAVAENGFKYYKK